MIGVGGFLGIGEKSVALKMDRLQISQGTDGVQLMMDVKKDELANAPSFKSRKDQDAEKQAAERARNQPQPQRRTGRRPSGIIRPACGTRRRGAQLGCRAAVFLPQSATFPCCGGHRDRSGRR